MTFAEESLTWRNGAQSPGLLLVGWKGTCTEGSAFATKTRRPELCLCCILGGGGGKVSPGKSVPPGRGWHLLPAVPEEATSVSKDLTRGRYLVLTAGWEAPVGSTDPSRKQSRFGANASGSTGPSTGGRAAFNAALGNYGSGFIEG